MRRRRMRADRSRWLPAKTNHVGLERLRVAALVASYHYGKCKDGGDRESSGAERVTWLTGEGPPVGPQSRLDPEMGLITHSRAALRRPTMGSHDHAPPRRRDRSPSRSSQP